MSESLFTFRRAAEIFCKVDGRTDSDVSAVYLQIKGLYDRGLLNAAAERAARGANQISFKEVCRARLLLVLLELGIESDDLQRANASLESGGAWTSPDGQQFRFNLDSAIGAESLWVLAINMGRDRLEGGKLEFLVRLMPDWLAAHPINKDWEGYPGGDPSHPESQVYFLGVTHLGYVKVPASKLFGDLKSAIDA